MIPPILIPIPPGELMDRISILKLKVARAKNPDQRENFALELEKLLVLANPLPQSPALADCLKELEHVNAILWDVEDQLRLLEREQAFGAEFIQLARSVYQTNDRRCAIKRQINILMEIYDPGEKIWSFDKQTK
jgi:hypothetical protein